MNDLSRDGWLVSVVAGKESDGRRRLGWAKGGVRGGAERVDEPGSEVG